VALLVIVIDTITRRWGATDSHFLNTNLLQKKLMPICLQEHVMADDENFSGFGPNPVDEQGETMELLTQPTRHRVLQILLGHPDHLVSKTEFDQYIPRSKPAIQNAIDELNEEGILRKDRMSAPDNPNEEDYPTVFIGLTPQGVQTLAEYNFLGAVPVLRAVFDRIDKNETQERHLHADRPELPEEVHQMLHFNEPDSEK
jgi:hypothetical protein